MAVRFDIDTTKHLRRTTDLLDPSSPYTVMLWADLITAPGSITTFMMFSSGSATSREGIRTNAGGNRFQAFVSVGGTASNTNGTTVMSAPGLYHLAMVRESATSLKLYVNGVLDAELTTDISARGAMSQQDIGIDRSTGPADARISYMKAWNVAFSEAEINQEMRTVRPQLKLNSLYGWWPVRPGSGERVKDYSGNVRDWTEGGTLTDEAPPAIGWGARPGFRPRVATGASIPLTLAIASASTTPDTVAAAVARALALAGGAASSTPDAILAVARPMALAAASASTTPDTVTLLALIPLALAAASASTTPDAVLAVARALALAGASASTTPDTVAAAVARSLALAGLSGSTTGDMALTVSGIIDFALTVASQSTTPDTVAAAVARALTLAAVSASTTPDAALAVSRALALAGASASTTPDGVSLGVLRSMALAIASASTTGSINFRALLGSLLDRLFHVFSRRSSFVLSGGRTIELPGARRSFEGHLMAVAEVPKDPAEVVDYTLDYATLLGAETIVTSVWAVASGDAVIDDSSETATTTTVRVSAGTLGTLCKLKNTITTSGGQTIVRRLVLVLQEM